MNKLLLFSMCGYYDNTFKMSDVCILVCLFEPCEINNYIIVF